MKNHAYYCPECGTPGVEFHEEEIQEIDPYNLTFRAPELLKEFQCRQCGWYAVAVSSLVS